MIENFKDKKTRDIYYQKFTKKLPTNIQEPALRKLILIDDANDIKDLAVPPGNHLEKLGGNRNGQDSIRINNQYRICFNLIKPNHFFNVEIVDYH